MRRIRYQVAMSLDGYIAGAKGEADWIIMDPEIDFGAIFDQFDTILMGRHTFMPLARQKNAGMPGKKVFVFSTTLRQKDHPDVTIVSANAEATVAEFRAGSEKDIWLFGGGLLFRSLLAAKQVDTVEVAVVPVLLGGGIPFLPAPAGRVPLKLTGHKIYKTGIVLLQYAVQ